MTDGIEQAGWAEGASVSDIASRIEWEQASVYLEQRAMTVLSDRERRDGVQLVAYPGDVQLDQWPRGRIFDLRQELRWERQGTVYHLVYCGDQIPLGFTLEPLHAVRWHDLHYFAWGRMVPPPRRSMVGVAANDRVYVEMQIPRLFRYPVGADVDRVQIEMREFYQADGSLCYVRWRQIVSTPESEVVPAASEEARI